MRGQTVRFFSKPGLPGWDRVSRATLLLADAVQTSPGARVLILGCGQGALGVALGRAIAESRIDLSDISFAALQMAERTIHASGASNVAVDYEGAVALDSAESFDVVAVELPSARKLARRWLLEAHAALRPGGELYLAGPNNAGIQPAIGDARDLFGNAIVLAYKAGNRVARVHKEAQAALLPAWAAEPGIAPGSWHEFDVNVGGTSFHLRSLPGVFAYDRLDEGTALLLPALEILPGARVLDVGCGYGIIGLVASRLGAAHVDMVDANLLAVASARENIALNALANIAAFPSDVTSAVAGNRYDLIVSNPPFHAGKMVDYDVAATIVDDARHLLNPGGRLVLVANRFIRYDRLMRGRYTSIRILAETGKFHVLEGKL